MPHYYHQAGLEPSLDEVLADPIVHLILQRDRIDVGTLLQYVDEARSRLQRDADTIPPRRGAASDDGGHAVHVAFKGSDLKTLIGWRLLMGL